MRSCALDPSALRLARLARSGQPARPMNARPRFSIAVAFCAAPLVVGCASLASSPAWTGGGLALSAPVREAEEEARVEKDRVRAAREPREIGAKHILVMHAESKSKPPTVTRSKDEGRKRAQQALVRIRSGEAFDALVKEYSDEPGAADRAGDLVARAADHRRRDRDERLRERQDARARRRRNQQMATSGVLFCAAGTGCGAGHPPPGAGCGGLAAS